MSKDNNSNLSDKDIATQKPNSKRIKISDVAAKASTARLCNCLGSKPGIVNSDIYAHEPRCRFRKKIASGRYTVSTSVMPRRLNDGYGLGVVIPGGTFSR